MGQEMREGAPVGVFADPLLQAPGNGGTLDDVSMLTTLDAYHLMAGSPAIDAALDPLSFVADPGSTDFFGTELPQGVGYDIGAHELR
jgi:hypothetical protein